jgi:hypothetical protein
MIKVGRGKDLLPKWTFYSLLVFVAFFIFAHSAEAAVTGKIAGYVYDANTGEPLPGANVLIEGTDRGAACDADGYYFISRLDPGNYSIQARMMGYKSLTKTGVRVISGHTTPTDFQLETTVVRGEGVTVQAQREIIRIDLSSSSITADRADIEAVPLISDVTQYLNLQAGIDGWSVRGSGLEDTKLMADGLLLVDQRANEPIMMPNLSEIKEISLIRGGFNAEYSNVRAGVINVVTREGSPKGYEGTFEFRFTPAYQKHSDKSIYDPECFYNEIYFRNKLDTGVQWNVDFFTEDTIGLDTVIRLDSVCWKGPAYVWGNPESPFYDTVKWNSCSKKDWKGWISDASGKPITPEGLRDRLLWRRRIDPMGDTMLPSPDSLFSIYSNDSMYVPIWDITVEDGDTTYDLMGYTREPYQIPADQPRIGVDGGKPDWTLDAGFGGPVPILGQYLGDMSFYASYRDFNEAFPFLDSRDYYRERQASLKLTSRFGNIKVNLRGAYSILNSLSPWESGEVVGYENPGFIGQVYLRGANGMLDSRGEWNGMYHGSDKIEDNPIALYNVDALTPFDIRSQMYGLSLQHALSENTFYDVRVTYLQSNNDANFWYDVPVSMRDTVLIWFGEKFNTEGEYITNRDHIARYAANNIPFGTPHPDFYVSRLVGDEDVSVWGPAQTLGTYNHSWSQSFGARFDLTSQINKFNEIKIGFEVSYDKIYEDYIINENFDWPEPGEEDDFGDGPYYVNYDASPILGGVYLQDKIEFEGMFANLGLRLDYADPNTEWPSREHHLYSPYYSSNLKSELFEQDSILEDVSALLKLSPRVGISFPILEKSKLFFNYGHFYSLAPSENRFMVGWGRANDVLRYIGNPWIDMSRTISYELGFESNIADMFLARVTGYYKDNDNEYAMVGYRDSRDEGLVDYNTYENLEYSDTRGFEFELRKPHGRFFTGWVIYDYRVRSEGKIGREQHYDYAVDEAKEGLNDPEQTEPVPQPVWTAQVTFKTPVDWGIFFGGYNLSFLYSWRAGRYETWNPFGDPTLDEILQNNIQWENERNMDLSLSKSISVAGSAVTLFMDVHNIFDWQELHQLGFHGDRTKYLKSLHLEIYNEEPYFGKTGYTPPAEGEEPDHVGDLSSDGKPWINDPNREFLMYLDPRYVQLGIRFSF